MVCTLKRLEKLGEYMNTRLEHSDLPELRDFLDNLPKKPCPSKLPEEYCKLCRRLNGEVAGYCETKKLPSPLEKEAFEERKEPETEEMEEHRVAHRVPILEHPTYKEGDTSLEFVPSDKSIEEAKRSLPRFIPVHRGPRPFRPLEEPGLEEFETFTMERPSIFRSSSSLAEGEEDMLFTLVSDEGAIEVTPLEIDEEASIPSETIFESSDGVVEAVEISEEAMPIDIERELPVFEFLDEGEGEIVEAEIVEAEIVEEGLPGGDAAFMPEGVIPSEERPPPSKKMKPGVEVEKIKKKVPRKPRKKRRIKRKLRLKKIKEKKPEEPGEGEVKPEPVGEKPEERKHRLESLKGIIPSEEIKTLAELLEQKPELKPREEILKERMEPEPSPEMLPPHEEPKEEAPTEKIDADLYMCPSCGSFLSFTATKCIHCGFDFEAEEEAIEEPPEEEKLEERLEPEPSEEPKPPEEIKPKDEKYEEKPEEEPKEEKFEPEPGPEVIPPREEIKEDISEERMEPEPSPEMILPEEEPKEEMVEPEPGEEIKPPEEIRFDVEMEEEEKPKEEEIVEKKPAKRKARKKRIKKKKKMKMKKVKLKRAAK